MGLLTIIKKQKLKDNEIRVLTLGLDNSGKTTIIKKMLNQDINTISPTMGSKSIHYSIPQKTTTTITTTVTVTITMNIR